MSNKTADGLRDRLFDTLDALIDKKIGKNEVESVCYLSEQILKTAEIELNIMREVENSKVNERRFLLEQKKEERESKKMLSELAGSIKVLEDAS